METEIDRLFPMMRRFIFVIFFFFLTSFDLFALTPEPAAIDGEVVLVKMGTRQLVVAYKRPGALMDSLSAFQVDPKTQFENIHGLAALRIRDSVAIKYSKTQAGVLLAEEITKQLKPEKPALAGTPEIQEAK